MDSDSQKDKETREKITSTVLTYVVPALVGGLAMIGSPTLGWLVVFVCLTICWFLATWGRFPSLTRRFIKYPGYGLIGTATLISALWVHGGKSDTPEDANQPVVTPPPVTATLQNSPGSNVVAIGTATNVTVNQADHQGIDDIRRKMDALDLKQANTGG